MVERRTRTRRARARRTRRVEGKWSEVRVRRVGQIERVL